jgi:hypothetical protein
VTSGIDGTSAAGGAVGGLLPVATESTLGAAASGTAGVLNVGAGRGAVGPRDTLGIDGAAPAGAVAPSILPIIGATGVMAGAAAACAPATVCSGGSIGASLTLNVDGGRASRGGLEEGMG